MSESKALLLFDGVCNTCNAVVDFLLKKDKHDRFLFASLQSPAAEVLLKKYNQEALAGPTLETVVLIYQDQVFIRSRAVFKTLKILGWPWKALCIFQVVPRGLSDGLYSLFAKCRYFLFGKRNTCRVPTEAEKAKFLN